MPSAGLLPVVIEMGLARPLAPPSAGGSESHSDSSEQVEDLRLFSDFARFNFQIGIFLCFRGCCERRALAIQSCCVCVWPCGENRARDSWESPSSSAHCCWEKLVFQKEQVRLRAFSTRTLQMNESETVFHNHNTLTYINLLTFTLFTLGETTRILSNKSLRIHRCQMKATARSWASYLFVENIFRMNILSMCAKISRPYIFITFVSCPKEKQLCHWWR